MGKTEQMTFHFPRAIENGVTEEELVELITHLAFYAGWPNAMSAVTRAKNCLPPNRKAGHERKGRHAEETKAREAGTRGLGTGLGLMGMSQSYGTRNDPESIARFTGPARARRRDPGSGARYGLAGRRTRLSPRTARLVAASSRLDEPAQIDGREAHLSMIAETRSSPFASSPDKKTTRRPPASLGPRRG